MVKKGAKAESVAEAEPEVEEVEEPEVEVEEVEEPAAVVAPITPSVVPASSLKSGDKFEFQGVRYQAGNKGKDCVVAADIVTSRAVTFGLNAMVKPII